MGWWGGGGWLFGLQFCVTDLFPFRNGTEGKLKTCYPFERAACQQEVTRRKDPASR